MAPLPFTFNNTERKEKLGACFNGFCAQVAHDLSPLCNTGQQGGAECILEAVMSIRTKAGRTHYAGRALEADRLSSAADSAEPFSRFGLCLREKENN